MAPEAESIMVEAMTWEEAERRFPRADVVALPCGSTEQHSLHLPLSVDTIRAEELTVELARMAPEYGLDIIVLPSLPYGYSEHHMTFSGTVTLSPATYQDSIVDIGSSAARHGARRFLLLNGHGGNQEPLKLATDRLQRDHDLRTHLVYWTEFAREQLRQEFGEEWGHAGEHETSVIEHYRPDVVRDDKKVSQSRRKELRTRPYDYIDEVTVHGGYGDPTKSDPEFVEGVIRDTTERILEDLKRDIGSDSR